MEEKYIKKDLVIFFLNEMNMKTNNNDDDDDECKCRIGLKPIESA